MGENSVYMEVINKQKTGREVQFQKCITEYQIGAAKVTRAEVDMWIKEAENADRVRGNKEKESAGRFER
ncbi:unnamed protein product [Rhizophagus irregularis]|nr:unnamed protein product [Rhizophagus irregularis]